MARSGEEPRPDCGGQGKGIKKEPWGFGYPASPGKKRLDMWGTWP
jgi:hypothetical protein